MSEHSPQTPWHPVVGSGQALRSLCIVLTAVALFCLLTTLSTAFEHTYDINWKLIDGAYRPCNQTLANVSPTPYPTSLTTPTHTMMTEPKAATAWQPDEQQQQPTTTGTGTGTGTEAGTRTRTNAMPSYLEHSDSGSGSGSGGGESGK